MRADRRQIETFIRKGGGCVTACRLRFITRADEIYFHGEQMNTKTNFRWPSDSTSFFNFLRAPASPSSPRRIIVKYDYSVSRRLFLTLAFSPFIPSLAFTTIGDRRTIDWYRVESGVQSGRLSSNDIAQSGELIEISGALSFSATRFSLAADCFRNFPRVSGRS